jgi:hypothetical protein
MQAYQTSQYVVPRGGIFVGKWSRSFAGNSDCKMNAPSACALNTRYNEKNMDVVAVMVARNYFRILAEESIGKLFLL